MKDLSPFGQVEARRRVAIAGVLAMNQNILDEPTAGLDPRGRDEILSQINKVHLQTKYYNLSIPQYGRYQQICRQNGYGQREL